MGAPPPLLVPTSPTATPPPATTVPTLSEPSTLPRGRLRLRPMLRPIPTTDTATPDLATLASGATEDMVLATAVDTPALDTPDSATAVDTSEDMATATAVVTDTTVKSTQPKDQHNAGAQLSPELASVSALSYLTAGYYLATKESKLK